MEVDVEVKCVRVDGGGEVHNEVHCTFRLAVLIHTSGMSFVLLSSLQLSLLFLPFSLQDCHFLQNVLHVC